MAKNIRIAGDEVRFQLSKVLENYNSALVARVNPATEAAAKQLVAITQENAPKKTGLYRRKISCKLNERLPTGDVWIWYVKVPRHRVTHLLVHGHAKRNGGRTRANPFLENGINMVQPEFEKAIEAAVKETK